MWLERGLGRTKERAQSLPVLWSLGALALRERGMNIVPGTIPSPTGELKAGLMAPRAEAPLGVSRRILGRLHHCGC